MIEIRNKLSNISSTPFQVLEDYGFKNFMYSDLLEIYKKDTNIARKKSWKK